jgi:hypothetical protein
MRFIVTPRGLQHKKAITRYWAGWWQDHKSYLQLWASLPPDVVHSDIWMILISETSSPLMNRKIAKIFFTDVSAHHRARVLNLQMKFTLFSCFNFFSLLDLRLLWDKNDDRYCWKTLCAVGLFKLRYFSIYILILVNSKKRLAEKIQSKKHLCPKIKTRKRVNFICKFNTGAR